MVRRDTPSAELDTGLMIVCACRDGIGRARAARPGRGRLLVWAGRALLDADEVDRLSINLCPELVGGGVRLFEDGIPASSWTLNDMATSESGAVWMYYDRVHQGS